LVQALTGGVTTLGEDGAAALKVEAYRPQPRARSPREPTHRLRSEDWLPREEALVLVRLDFPVIVVTVILSGIEIQVWR